MIYCIILFAFITAPFSIKGMIQPPTVESFSPSNSADSHEDINIEDILALIDADDTQLKNIDLSPLPESLPMANAQELSFLAKAQKCELPKALACNKRKTAEKNLNFLCIQCEAAFESHDKYQKHFLDEHRYIASLNRYSINKEEAVNVEANQRIACYEARPKPYKCSYENCTKSFLSERNMRDHLANHARQRPSTCMEPGCALQFRTHAHLQVHMKTHGPRTMIQCPKAGCPKSYLTELGLTKHLIKMH